MGVFYTYLRICKNGSFCDKIKYLVSLFWEAKVISIQSLKVKMKRANDIDMKEVIEMTSMEASTPKKIKVGK